MRAHWRRCEPSPPQADSKKTEESFPRKPVILEYERVPVLFVGDESRHLLRLAESLVGAVRDRFVRS